MSFFSKSCPNCWDYPCTCGSSHKNYVANDEKIVKTAKIDAIISFVKNTGLYAEQKIRDQIIKDLEDLKK